MTDSPVIKRSVTIAGHSTSVSLEQPFWDELQKLAQQKNVSLNHLLTEIDGQSSGNLSSALRLFVLRSLKQE